jgi:hypothetical protein
MGDADRLVGADMQTVLAERIRDAELRVYEGVGAHTAPGGPGPLRGRRRRLRRAVGSAETLNASSEGTHDCTCSGATVSGATETATAFVRTRSLAG